MIQFVAYRVVPMKGIRNGKAKGGTLVTDSGEHEVVRSITVAEPCGHEA